MNLDTLGSLINPVEKKKTSCYLHKGNQFFKHKNALNQYDKKWLLVTQLTLSEHIRNCS